MMLEIVRQALPSIVVAPTSKRKESLSGTDFELWLGSDRSGWVRLAVQAKELHLASGNYHGFNHKVGHAKALQINLLENYAQADKAIPLYCLYNYTVNLSPLLYGHCCQGQEAFQPKQLGCTITPSSTIKETLSQYGGKNFNNIHRAARTLPWRCLACPELGPVHANTPNYVVSVPIVQKNASTPSMFQLGGFRHIFTHREKLTVIYSDSSYLPSPPILSVSMNRP